MDKFTYLYKEFKNIYVMLNKNEVVSLLEKLGFEGVYSLKHLENFKELNKPCYLPENWDSLNDLQTKEDMIREATEFFEQDEAKEYLIEAYDGTLPKIDNEFVLAFVDDAFHNDLEWEYFSTYLSNLLV